MGLLNKLDGCVRACLGFLVARILIALIVTAMTVAIATIAFAQTSGTATESEPAAGGNASPVQGTSGTEDDTSVETDPPTRLAIPAEVEVEIQRHINELRREQMDDRATYFDRLLAIFALVVAFASYLGFKKIREIVAEAKSSAKASAEYAEASSHHLKEIEKNREISDEIVRAMNAQTAADDPGKAKQAIEDARNNPTASLIDKAIANALDLQRQEKNKEAIEKWRGIASIAEGADNSLAARAWFSVGYLLQDDDPKDGISAYDESIRLNPDNFSAYNNRGVAKAALGQHKAAINDYDKAILLKPDYANAYSNRGTAKDELKRYGDAIADYDEAIHLKPDFAEAYSNRGNTKGALGQHDAAIADYNEAIRLKPDLAEAWDGRGNAKGALGQHDAAIADYNKAIRLKPDYAEAYMNRGNTKGALGQHDAAIADYNEAIRLKPDLAEAWDGRGNAKQALELYEPAIDDYDEAIRLKPDYAEAYYNRGIAKQALDLCEPASADYDQAIRLKPDYAKAYGNRGRAKAVLGLKDEARQDLETALELARNANNAKIAAQAEKLLRNLNDAGDS